MDLILRPVRCLLLILALPIGCHSVTSAAAKDPRRCEQDPNCVARQGKANDCITACSDDIACIDRCRQVTGQFK